MGFWQARFGDGAKLGRSVSPVMDNGAGDRAAQRARFAVSRTNEATTIGAIRIAASDQEAGTATSCFRAPRDAFFLPDVFFVF